MPLYDFVCEDCEHKQEHFVFSIKSYDLKCPKCGCEIYKRQVARCKSDVEYSDPQENYDKKIKPHVQDTYAAMGRDALADSTKTADDIFGTQKVKDALGG